MVSEEVGEFLKCEDEHDKLASQVSLYYTINAATADFFRKTMKDIKTTNDEVMIDFLFWCLNIKCCNIKKGFREIDFFWKK